MRPTSWDEAYAERYEFEALYGGFEHEPFSEGSREYVFVTRRPDGSPS